SHKELARAQHVMQTRSFRGSGEPVRVNASSNARFGLGPDPRRALGPAAIRAASTGRTHDRTRPMLHQRKKALVNQAPSTHDPLTAERSSPPASRARNTSSAERESDQRSNSYGLFVRLKNTTRRNSSENLQRVSIRGEVRLQVSHSIWR